MEIISGVFHKRSELGNVLRGMAELADKGKLRSMVCVHLSDADDKYHYTRHGSLSMQAYCARLLDKWLDNEIWN